MRRTGRIIGRNTGGPTRKIPVSSTGRFQVLYLL